MTAGRVYTVSAWSGEYGTKEVQLDSAGNLAIADGQRVRVVADSTGTFYGQAMTAGHIYTVAGGGTQAAGGTPALLAKLTASVVAVDQAGTCWRARRTSST